MNRLLFIGVLLMLLSISACGSNPSDDPSAPDTESLIETRVASTVAATLSDDDAPSALAPTFPAISGNATPLTPIPQYEESYIEVSPEVEYAPEGREDGPVTFDFGGGATATAGPTSLPAPSPAPTRSTLAAVGGTVFPGEAYGMGVALTLLDAQFVDTITDQYDREVQAPAGFRFLSMTWTVLNATQNPIDAKSLQGQAEVLLISRGALVKDRDGDYFGCVKLAFNVEKISGRGEAMFLPGYGFSAQLVCQIPVTASAEELDGLWFEQSDPEHYGYDFEFSLGERSGVATDLTHLDHTIEAYSWPVSQKGLCGLEIGTPFTIESVVWYDAPRLTPEEYQLQAIAERMLEDQRLNQRGSYVPGAGIPNSPEEARQQLLDYWANGLWATYDFQALDLVAIRIIRSNSGKSNVLGGFLSEGGSISIISDDQFTPTEPVSSVSSAGRLVEPLAFINTYYLAPGKTEYSTLYALASELDERIRLLLQTSCGNALDGRKWVILDFPRTAYDQSWSSPANSSGSVEVAVSAMNSRTVSLAINAGQEVTIEYRSGTWQPGAAPQWPPVGPEGDIRVPGKASFPIPDAPLMALIFGIEGGNQIVAFEGNPATFTAEASGNLWFGPNDDGLADNSGELVVVVTSH